jgi:hypothetical protein
VTVQTLRLLHDHRRPPDRSRRPPLKPRAQHHQSRPRRRVDSGRSPGTVSPSSSIPSGHASSTEGDAMVHFSPAPELAAANKTGAAGREELSPAVPAPGRDDHTADRCSSVQMARPCKWFGQAAKQPSSQANRCAGQAGILPYSTAPSNWALLVGSGHYVRSPAVGRYLPPRWNGSWSGAFDNPSATSIIRAMTHAIAAASALDA